MSSEKRARRLSTMIYVSFFVSLLFLFIVGQVLGKNIHFRESADFDIPGWEFRYLFYGLSVVVIMVIRHLKSFLYTRAKNTGREECLHRMIAAVTVIASLCEIPALLGLGNLLTGGLKQDFILLLGLSLLLLAMHFPRPSIFAECIRVHSADMESYDVSPE